MPQTPRCSHTASGSNRSRSHTLPCPSHGHVHQAWDALNVLSSKLTKGDQAWVFTSGGTIASIMLHLLELRDNQFMDLQGRLVNTSITRLAVGRRGLALSTFNEYSHLEHNSTMVTYR